MIPFTLTPEQAAAVVEAIRRLSPASQARIAAVAANLRKDAQRAQHYHQAWLDTGEYVPGKGAQVIQARALAGLSQRDLAKHLTMSRGHLADVELGRRNAPPALVAWVTKTLEAGG